MRVYKCDSSLIEEFGYDSRTGTLVVTFRNGSRYVYENVTENDRRALRRAKSKGRRFNARIRNKPYRRVG